MVIMSLRVFLVVLGGLLWFWHFLKRRRYSYILESILGPAPSSWIEGSLSQIMNHDAWSFHQRIAETYGRVIRIKGTFGSDNLYVFDVKALHHILIKDQHIYEEAEWFIEGHKLVFGAGILTTTGDDHRRQRKILNPIFSAARMREMIPIFYDVSRKVRNTFVRKAQLGPQEINFASWMGRLSLELIGQSGLGYTFDNLSDDSAQHPYSDATRQLPAKRIERPFVHFVLLPQLSKLFGPGFVRLLNNYLPFKFVAEFRNILKVVRKTSNEIISSKKKALVEGDEAVAAQVGHGKDLISVLMKRNVHATGDDKLSDLELTSQIGTLTAAATDTTSNALSRIFHILALHKDAQAKLREELRQAREANSGDDLDYDQLSSLPYLDAVIRESLRLYPPVSTLDRIVKEDVILPLGTPVKGMNGQEINEVPIPKGTKVFISIYSANRDAELWGPDVCEWKPERWLNPLPDTILNARIPGVYSHLLTFLGGSRSCIGFKFSELEMKVAIALLVEALEFSPSDKQIYWHMTGIASPNIDLHSSVANLPMVISMAK